MRRILSFPLFLLTFACGGDGCGGLDAIEGGFPLEERGSRAVQLRVTERGLGFLEEHAEPLLGAIVSEGLVFDIDRYRQRRNGIRFTVCDDRNCAIRADIEGLRVSPAAPNRLVLLVDLVVTSRNRRGGRRAIPVEVDAGFRDKECDLDINTSRGSRRHITLRVALSIATVTAGRREGYSFIDVQSARLDRGFQDADLRIRNCGGLGGDLIDFFFEAFEDDIVGALVGEVEDEVESELRDQLGGELLGFEGQVDLGEALLSELSPGTTAPVQFVVAGEGNATVAGGGINLDMFGGFRGVGPDFRTSPAHHPCVPRAEPPAVATAPSLMALRTDEVPGTSHVPHLGVAVANSYLNQVAFSLYDAGFFCVGVGTEQSPQLTTGLLSLAVPGLTELVFPETNAPLSIALRPQAPPTVRVGDTARGEALLEVSFPRLALDFYAWVSERYVRVFTLTSDVAVSLDLRAEDGGLVPELREVLVTGGEVSNDALIEAPETLAETLAPILEMFVGAILGDLSDLELPDLMGVRPRVVDGGVVGVAEGGARFLVVYVDLEVGAEALVVQVETELVSHQLLDAPPGVDLDVRAVGVPAGSRPEFSARVDGHPWSPWTEQASDLLVRSDVFLLEGHHLVEARARVRGTPGSEDPTPARRSVVVDRRAPSVELETNAREAVLFTRDLLTNQPRLEYRWRWSPQPGGSEGFGPWAPHPPDGEPRFGWPERAEELEVEVRDESGNVGRASLRRSDDLGSACSPAGSAPASLVLVLLATGALVCRRRRRLR